MNRSLFPTIVAALLLALAAPACKAEGHQDMRSERWTGESISFDVLQKGSDLSGTMWSKDPKSGELVRHGDLIGQRDGDSVELTTTTGAAVRGTFSGNMFTGTITLPAWLQYERSTHDLTLERKASGAQ